MSHSHDDPFDLGRFVSAQEGTVARALSELQEGRKRSHWMWFVFPQIAGLGSSPMAQRYAIGSLDEARAYLAHPLLGQRLRDCTLAAVSAPGSAHDVFGNPDDMKFRSSMTLFALAAPEEALFTRALDRFYGGQQDPATLEGVRG
ncbi:DUF1810 domain-containing protein [Methylobacterium persicinum]|uniref:Uncharacterized protein (DUF1810 family) n=1 Tax=Methylobacterium persicinum TaxID=374426 RepID=A0ABU0HNK6_9HYPH|nr:DUF1810 domain-containing protein [Methylobacterium persicinum]MDQ0443886.1 uncharacterized protein (DUF1810 family) [Methylobacterium persicinum]GJE37577.1 hypothetical protein KHHGKMAE_1636 [Methylobacterium persicinum]